ncbi:peptide ABC transporter substrate-binding protein [Acidiphilium sp. AL]|uniref:peptide ABC transporter substrate-binding protein n=1 Tax=Acidiphilium sp. AL TaxID=2871704 RepID=UPI0021CB1134|nr:peptide ABC transporter substrate-binding protein [Acidiphilium sp. AL]MCU4160121.1 peptide ABC transporter substrate-binding protein [Acidiphilium sp. AL]
MTDDHQIAYTAHTSPRNRRPRRLSAAVLTLATIVTAPAVFAGAPPICGTVIVPPGVGLGTPPGSVTSLNPLLAKSAYDTEASGLLYYGLLWVNRDHKIDWSRSLATKIDVSTDDTTFTVSMKPWTWSDGVPVTAADVKYTYDLIRKLGPTFLNYGTGGVPTLIKSLAVLSPEKFQVVMKHPVNPDWFELQGLPILTPFPAHSWGKYTINQIWRRQSQPSFVKVVDGPYRVVSFRMGRHVVFGVNPTYQGHKPEIPRLVMKFLHSSGAVIAGMKTGTLDIGNLPFSLWQAGRRLQNINLLRMTPNWGFDFIQINFRNPKVAFFRDLKVRQAFADAIDQKAAIKLLFHGMSHAQHGPVPVDPPTFLSPSARAGKYPVGYDPARARGLLDAAGWKPGADGIRVKDGRRLEFTYLTYAGGATAMLYAEMMQQGLRAVGIQMNIRQVTFNQLLALSHRPLTWEAMGFGWSLASYPSDGNQLETGGAYNQAGYSNKKLDRLIEAVRTEPGDKALYAYQDYAAEQQPEIFFNEPGSVVMVRNGLKGIRKSFPSTGSWSPQYLHWALPQCTARVAENASP